LLFENSEFLFWKQKNFIIWENWKWKTNILEALSLLSTQNLNNIDFNDLVGSFANTFFIEAEKYNWDIISISYDKINSKKIYTFNKKKTLKSKIKLKINKTVIFTPITMNMMYLSPSLRRDFLDQILLNTFDSYSKVLKEYKNILKSRNKTLKAINEWKININELDFWDKKFIHMCEIVYNYRFWLKNYFEKNIFKIKKYFWNKINKVDFIYKTKIKNNIKDDIKNYLIQNKQRDIILSKTNIWPHIDDFDILLDWKSIINFASRGETKSSIIELKFLEISFIEEYTNQKPILLIDDLLSEIDENHKNMILNELKWYQIFITSIINQYKNENIIFV